MQRPIITVMIQAKTPERILELIEKGKKGGRMLSDFSWSS